MLRMISTARTEYLKWLNENNTPVNVTEKPHEPSGLIAVYDSDLGYCPKRAGFSRNEQYPTHEGLLIENSPALLHLLRDGKVTELEWIATLKWGLREQATVWHDVPIHGNTRGVIDILVEFNEYIHAYDVHSLPIGGMIVEIKRTNGSFRNAYLAQVASYMRKMYLRGGQPWHKTVVGKIITDHRYTWREYTVLRHELLSMDGSGREEIQYEAVDSSGRAVASISEAELDDLIATHDLWMTRLSDDEWLDLLPDGITSPLSSWQCHRNWKKRAGTAEFNCPYAGYCFGTDSPTFVVENIKGDRGKIIARKVVINDETFYEEEN